MRLLLGIDVGTSGVKCLLVDEQGHVVRSATRTYPLDVPKPAWAQQNPADWWTGTAEALRELTAADDAKDIVAVGLSGQMHGLVALNAEGNVIRPAILWNDQRTEAQCARFIEGAGGIDALVDKTNNTMLPGFTGGKLMWLKENEPASYEDIATFVMPKDYIRYQLTSELATDVSDASGTGCFDVASSEWSDSAIAGAGLLKDVFPKVLESNEKGASGVSEEAAKATGLPAGIPVYGGGGDAVIQNAGMGIVEEGTLGIILGTSGVVATAMDKMGRNAKGRLQFFRGNEPGKYMVFGCQLSSAGSMEWFKNTFFPGDEHALETINREVEASPAGANGVVFLPYLTGERCPHINPDARGVFYGLSLVTGRGDVARAVMEGVSFGLYEIYELMRQANPDMKATQGYVSGGGSKSRAWRQILADIFDMPMKELTGAGEGGAYGAALVAGVGEGIWKSLKDTQQVHEVKSVTEPDAGAHGTYMRALELYKDLYQDLEGTYRKYAH